MGLIRDRGRIIGEVAPLQDGLRGGSRNLILNDREPSPASKSRSATRKFAKQLDEDGTLVQVGQHGPLELLLVFFGIPGLGQDTETGLGQIADQFFFSRPSPPSNSWLVCRNRDSGMLHPALCRDTRCRDLEVNSNLYRRPVSRFVEPAP